MSGRSDAQAGGGDGEHLYRVHLEKHSRRRESARPIFKLSKYWRSFNRRCSLVFGAYFCNLDLCASYDNVDGQTGQENADENRRGARWASLAGWLPSSIEQSAWRSQKLRFAWIARALLIVHLMSFTIMCANILYLYLHEINRMRLQRVRDLIQVHGRERRVFIAQTLMCAYVPVSSSEGSTLVSLDEFEQLLQVRIGQLRLTLAHLGDNFIERGLIAVCLLSIALVYNLIFYVLTKLVYSWIQRFDHQFLRDQIEPQAEERHVDWCCERLVLKYLESNRVYSTIVAEYKSRMFAGGHRQARRSYANLGATIQVDSSVRSKRTSSPAIDLHNNLATTGIGQSDFQACCLLMRMLTSGALRPSNRCPVWIEYRELANAIIYSLTFLWTCVALAAAVYTLYGRTTTSESFDAGELCMLIILSFNTSALVFHVTATIVSHLDQALLVRRVLSQIRECIRLNEGEFSVLTRGVHSARAVAPAPVGKKKIDENLIIERVNSNHLFALMTYKMFVIQFAPFKRTHRGLFLVCFSTGFVIPVMALIFVPYLDHDTNFRLAILAVSMFSLVPVNMVCVPMCYLHARCQRVFNELSNLMAHVSKVRQHQLGARIYNEHAIVALFKELANPKQMLDQFRVESPIGLNSTYSDLLVLHFWWGLVVVSFHFYTRSNDNQDSRSQFGAYLNDPLGIWCFHAV